MDPSPAVRPTVGVQSGRISMTHKNGAKPKRLVRHYTVIERQAAIALALQVGIRGAWQRTGYPEATIQVWVDKAGGIKELRAKMEEVASVGLSTMEQALYEEMARRAAVHELSEAELGENVRALIAARLNEAKRGEPGAVAAAQAVSEVRVIVEDNRG